MKRTNSSDAHGLNLINLHHCYQVFKSFPKCPLHSGSGTIPKASVPTQILLSSMYGREAQLSAKKKQTKSRWAWRPLTTQCQSGCQTSETKFPLLLGKNYCTKKTKCSVTRDTQLFLMCAKITIIRKENFRSSRTSKTPKLMNTWSF